MKCKISYYVDSEAQYYKDKLRDNILVYVFQEVANPDEAIRLVVEQLTAKVMESNSTCNTNYDTVWNEDTKELFIIDRDNKDRVKWYYYGFTLTY